MKHTVKIILLFLILSAACSLLHTPQVQAQNFGLAVDPPILQITTNPPALVKAPITIANTSDDPVTLQIALREFKQTDSRNGTVEYLPEDKKPSPDSALFQKVQVLDGDNAVQTIELAPQQEKKLQLVIDIPKDEPLSDYYFSTIFISNKASGQQQNTSSQAQGGIAVNVLLSIGTEAASGYIDQFDVPKFLFKGPVPFTLSVHNDSHHVIAPEGAITISNVFGQTIGQVNLLPVNILSGTSRFIPDDRSLNENNLSNQQILWPETALLGPYAATMRIKLSDNGPLFVRTIHFFALPVPAIAALIILILIGIIAHDRVKKKL